MGETDWTYQTEGLDAAAVRRGVTAAVPPPPGGGDFVFALHSTVVTRGAVALALSQTDFTPTAKGASVRGCLQRGPSGGPTGFAPYLFAAAQGASVNDVAYLLGLTDEDPHRVALVKGALVRGIPAGDDASVLLVSSESYLPGRWHHLRLDAITNPNGDVVLVVLANDLAAHPLGAAPAWTPIAGMPTLIDDPLGIRTGTPALTAGRIGFGFASRDVTRRAAFDHLELYRQL